MRARPSTSRRTIRSSGPNGTRARSTGCFPTAASTSRTTTTTVRTTCRQSSCVRARATASPRRRLSPRCVLQQQEPPRVGPSPPRLTGLQSPPARLHRRERRPRRCHLRRCRRALRRANRRLSAAPSATRSYASSRTAAPSSATVARGALTRGPPSGRVPHATSTCAPIAPLARVAHQGALRGGRRSAWRPSCARRSPPLEAEDSCLSLHEAFAHSFTESTESRRVGDGRSRAGCCC